MPGMMKMSRPTKLSRNRGRLAALVAGAALPLLAGSAQAQSVAPAVMAAEYASLGGATSYAFHDTYGGSALARITAAQSVGLPLPASPTLSASSTMSLTNPATAPYAAPSALVLANWTPTPLRIERAVARAPQRLAASPAGAPATTAPNVFGSVALKVSHTATGARWSRAAAGVAPTQANWKNAVAEASTLSDHARLALANTWLNKTIAFQSDATNYGMRDYWASARETVARGRGDCEDYAIAKMEFLRQAGIPQSSLYLVIARDLVRRADHALLLVRLDDGFWVLDSSTDEILPAAAVADYRPLVTYSAGREWIHGYRTAPRMVLASASSRLSPAFGR
jgi:predicted transglutaminase-like cysteine proteinase